jgi:hypothetical protein
MHTVNGIDNRGNYWRISGECGLFFNLSAHGMTCEDIVGLNFVTSNPFNKQDVDCETK